MDKRPAREYLYLYGPVASRRLGNSLGVDLIPYKVCSYDCIYCQLGRTTEKTVERKEYVSIDTVLKELDEKLNRNPQPDEIQECGPVLRRQLRAIRPKVILALGSFAAQFLLSSQQPISKIRNRIHQFEGIPVVPTYHPAYLLRNPIQKRQVWEDVQLLLSLLRVKN